MRKRKFFLSAIILLILVWFFLIAQMLFGITQGNLGMHCNAHRFAMTSVCTPAFQPEVGIA